MNGREEPIPQEVIDALAAVRESGVTNMFDRQAVIHWCNLSDRYVAVTWLYGNRNRYIEALNAMGDYISKEARP
jgi:hypothetical protein